MNALSRMDELSAEVEVLESKLSKTAELTQRISISLKKLSTSASQVETAVKPIYNKTQSLTLLSSNIDETIATIDRIRRPADAAGNEEKLIRQGPQKTGLNEYLTSLRRINEALQSLRQSNLKSSQKAMTQMHNLLKTGSLQLEERFRQELAEDSKPVEPLHYITKELPFPQFSSAKINTLAVLNDFLTSTLAASSGIQPNAPTIYAEVRGAYLSSSLSSLALATVNTTRRASTAPYDKGSNGIGMYTQSLIALLLAEYENLTALFPRSSWGPLFTATAQTTLAAFRKTLTDLNTFIKSSMATDLFLALEVLECVSPAVQRIKAATGEGGELADALKPLRETAQSGFNYVYDDVKRQGAAIIALPFDNTIAEITTDTMARLRRMAAYPTPVGNLLVALGDGAWKRPYAPGMSTPGNFDVGADGSVLFSRFCLDVIDVLINELEQKSRVLIKKSGAMAVFMVNNVAFIEGQVRRGELRGVMREDDRAKVEKWRKDAVKMYLEGWKECAAFLMDVTYTGKQGAHNSAKGLSGKEKDGVKEKFKNFNTAFEELVQRHKGYNFPDKDVRTMLAKEIGFIGPLYGRFYDKYKDLISPKYLKHDRQGLESILATL